MTNPIYAGAYAYGRSTHRIRLEQGRKRIVRGLRQNQENWSVLILDHHEGYISWTEYERNIEVIAHNAGNKGLMVRRAVRPGGALLTGCFDVATVAAKCRWVMPRGPIGIFASARAKRMALGTVYHSGQRVQIKR